jgi:hypothetical protein
VNPWADPSTPTEPGVPYAGPPPTVQPYPPYGHPLPFGHPGGYGQPAPWGRLPVRRPQRPGQVITAAVLAFAQAVVVLIASVYLWFIASLADVVAGEAGGLVPPGRADALAREGTVLAVVQLLSAVLLIGAAVWALNARHRGAGRLLVAALAVQVVLTAYWAVRLPAEFGRFDTGASVVSFALFFAAGPVVGLGMLLVGPGRRWYGGTPQA